MTPPERLHTRSEGLPKYMIDSLRSTIVDVGNEKKVLTKIENLYHTLYFHLKKNSERDFPRGSARNGALKDTLVSATEYCGNMFLLLCLWHTDAVHKDFETILCQSGVDPANFFKCLKLYISMKEWFHENNMKDEVNLANSLVAETLELLHTCFPGWNKDGNEEGQGWAVSKFHSVTKFVLYIKPFGNAINFYDGIGECNHKKFAKETRCNTQKRIRTFTSQAAQRYYDEMTLDIARKAMDIQTNINKNDHVLSRQEYNEDKSITILGRYNLTFVDLDDLGQFRDHYVSGRENKTLPIKFIRKLSLFCLTNLNLCEKNKITCHTSCKMILEQRPVILHATLDFGDDGSWYDWCLVEWVDHNQQHNTYPGKILVFFSIRNSVYAVIQSSSDLITMDQL